jgi:outer membrane scaffolding protein for murein synthesis (MipA/OmpV family)
VSRWVVILLLAAVGSPGASAEERALSLWEAGFGLSALSFPAYRGSDQQSEYLFPLPFLAYRGELLKVDREGLRGRLFDNERVILDLSLSGAVPVRSRDVDAREGMPDLDPLFEIGPGLTANLLEGADDRWQLRLRLPVRYAIATDLRGVDPVGWRFDPHLNFNTDQGGWNLGLNAGVLFADQRYHAYYYEVAPRYARPDRPAYQASGGYGGVVLLASASRRFDRFWVGGFLRYDDLDGAVFRDSPLVQTRSSWMGGVGVVWVFAQSKRQVMASE